MIGDFTAELCRTYHYDLAAPGLADQFHQRAPLRRSAASGRGRSATTDCRAIPLDQLTRPRRKSRSPAVPRREAVETLLDRCVRLRDRAILALLAYGGLRRSEVVGLNVGDYLPEFGLRRGVARGVMRPPCHFRR